MVRQQVRYEQIGGLIDGLGQSNRIGGSEHKANLRREILRRLLQMMCQDPVNPLDPPPCMVS
jgi:hypothetical protein